MKTTNVISLIQLPPPIHGASIINNRVNSILCKSELINNKSFRLNYAKNFEEMRSSGLIKSKYTIKLLRSILLEYLKNRPQITYIAFSPFGFGFYRDLFFVSLARLFSSKPYLHLHGTGLSTCTSKIKLFTLRWMFAKSKIIIISPGLHKDVASFTQKSNIITIENCVDDPGEYTKERSDTVKILYLANLDERKGVKTAISAFAKIKELGHDAQLIIAGSDTSLLTKASLQEYINSKYPSLREWIKLIGPVYGKEKHELFMASDVFLYPSRHDAAPLVVLEALSYGIPVICSSQGALPDMIKHGENGFISANNAIEEYAYFFQSCISHMNEISALARKTYLEKYSPSSFEEKIKELFLTGK